MSRIETSTRGGARPPKGRAAPRVAVLAGLAAGLVLSGAGTVRAAERLARAIHDLPGMPQGIAAVIQDTGGYIWIASEQGLDRFDGQEVRPWGREVVNSRLERLAAGPSGQLAAAFEGHPAVEVAGSSLVPIAGPDGAVFPDVRDLAFDRAGRLWLIAAGRLRWREADGAWREPAAELAARDDMAWLGGSLAIDGVFVSSRRGELYRVRPGNAAARIAQLPGGLFTRMHVQGDDALLATLRFGPHAGLYRVDGGGPQRLWSFADGARPTGLVQRGERTWIALDSGLFAIGAEGEVEALRPNDGFHGGGSLFVDREGSLWVGSFRGGLQLLPEPDTRWWTDRSGLPESRARAVYEVGGQVRAMTWSGPLDFVPEEDRWRRVPSGDATLVDRGCVDPWGVEWATGYRRRRDGRGEDLLARRRGDAFEVVAARPRFALPPLACAAAPEGGFWIVAGDELLAIDGAGARPRTIGRLPVARAGSAGPRAARALIVERDATLLLEDGRACRAALAALTAAARPAETAWECRPIAQADPLGPVLARPDGTLWIATSRGILAWDGTDAHPVIGPEALGFNAIVALSPSPSGGVWVSGRTRRTRIDVRDGAVAVVEELDEGAGVSAWVGGDLHEAADGTVWIATLAGIARVPPEARHATRRAPDVVFTRLRIDGVDGLDRRGGRGGGSNDAGLAGELAIPSPRSRLDVGWSARSYRVPQALRYRYRLDEDAGWAELFEPQVQFAGLGPGHYRLEVGASLDGESWTAEPAHLPFRVLVPWYRTWWALLLGAAVVSLLGHLVYRARVTRRLALERQRTEIASDLHDRMGSGLASIGLLANLLADESIAGREREAIADKIVSSAQRLGGEIGEIVWSLRPGAETLDALVVFLRQRTAELFADDPTRVVFEVPDPCPRLLLSLLLRRNLQWMAVEALSNARKYAAASRVTVALRPEGRRWRLSIRDDGVGFEPGRSPRGTGVGHESLRRRAERIGARVRIESRPGAGTQVAIEFDPRAGAGRLSRWPFAPWR